VEDLVAFASRPAPTRWIAHPLVLRTETGSTNDDVRLEAERGAPAGLVVLADAQRSGRGRRGRQWHSPAGESLYVSVLLRPALTPSSAPLITLSAGLAVAETLDAFVSPARVTVKWPNDVRVDGKKIAGVLVEGALRGEHFAWSIAGVGLNVRGVRLPNELAATATTIAIAIGHDPGRVPVLARLLACLEARFDALFRGETAALVRDLSARCDTLGTRVAIDTVVGTAEAIDPTGALCIRTDDGGTTLVRAGEVTAPTAIR